MYRVSRKLRSITREVIGDPKIKKVDEYTSGNVFGRYFNVEI